MDQNLLALFRPTRSIEILTKTAIDEDERTSLKNQITLHTMNAGTEEKKVQRTNPATPHFLKIEVIIPDIMIPEGRPTAVTLKPTRFVCFDAVEHRYVAYIRLKHPPFTGKRAYHWRCTMRSE